MADKVLVHRAMALGDVILTTPIIRELAKQGVDVDVSSNYPFVFKNNPYVKQALTPSQVNAADYDDVYNLDLVYENNPKMHIIEAYKNHVFGPEEVIDNMSLDLYTDEKDVYQAELFIEQEIKTPRFVVAHVRNDGWPSRNISMDVWGDLIERILDEHLDITVVHIGGKHEIAFEGDERLVNALGRFSIHGLKALIERATAFIGVDSAPFHIAATTKTPNISFFTAVNHEYRKPLGKDTVFEPLAANIDCYGCMADVPPPNTEFNCRRGSVDCVKSFDAEQVYNTVAKYL